MLHHRLFAWPFLALVVGAVSSLLGTGSARAADEGAHRALRAALYHLKEAREEVKEEPFKRHRERVEGDIRVAIREIEGSLREGKIEFAYEPPSGWDAKYKSFRHLRQALIELDRARDEISKEKGAWARRKELREAIDDAHKHVKEALEEIK